MVYKWNPQLTKASWCQKERWHHLPYMWHISLLCRPGIVTDVIKQVTHVIFNIDGFNIIVLDWYFIWRTNLI